MVLQIVSLDSSIRCLKMIYQQKEEEHVAKSMIGLTMQAIHKFTNCNSIKLQKNYLPCPGSNVEILEHFLVDLLSLLGR